MNGVHTNFWRYSFLALAMGLDFLGSAFASSMEISVTPDHLEHGRYRFAVSTRTATNGITFHVTVNARQADIPPGVSVDLSVVAQTENEKGLLRSITPVTPAAQIKVQKQKRVWTADFTVARELLKQPGLCFVLTEQVYSVSHGKKEPMGAAEFYEVQLSDFLPH